MRNEMCLFVIFELISNIFSGNWGYHRQGSCQAGLGAAISKVICFFRLDNMLLRESHLLFFYYPILVT